MRLIDADILFDDFSKTIKDCKKWEKDAKDSWVKTAAEHAQRDFIEAALRVKSQPTIDAVPVVRCKDCISSYEFEDWETGEKTRYCQRLRDYWNKEELWVNDDGFCCWGRKKKDA